MCSGWPLGTPGEREREREGKGEREREEERERINDSSPDV